MTSPVSENGLDQLRINRGVINFGSSEKELQEYVKKYVPKPVGDPIKMALSIVREPIEIHETQTSEDVEPDSRPEQY